MQIKIEGRIVTISGNIKSVSDYQAIKSQIEPLAREGGALVIKIPDSISMTSSVIGFFNKLVQKDGVQLTMEVGSHLLYELLEDLGLVNLFHVRKI